MRLQKVNFTILQGTTFSYQIKIENEDGSAFDLTGYTLRMQARVTLGDSSTVITSTGGSPNLTITCATPATGILYISMTPAQTAALDFFTALYDLEGEHDDGDVYRFLQGAITLSKEATR